MGLLSRELAERTGGGGALGEKLKKHNKDLFFYQKHTFPGISIPLTYVDLNDGQGNFKGYSTNKNENSLPFPFNQYHHHVYSSKYQVSVKMSCISVVKDRSLPYWIH